MTVNFSIGEYQPPDDLLAAAEQHYETALSDLLNAVNAVKAGLFDNTKALPQTVRDVRLAMDLIHTERGRLEKLRKQLAGSVGTGILDLHAARDEIGGRLARLRDAS
ncbi:hypothetical protein GCM10010873_35460 [Cypionkella aquatica]|uniref:Uncharacterized protein n=1 Tax=Cypionkella aquatica TaxID=1756042 RepID=A0AA37U379_9RHOB|nr:hypothetical protein [Cypionkella aquatica]GLS87386.1 hypothetical protein GCM10010873_23600 [Cypionkella aquatica]GLS88572.1 hypothetical protein GCM10010873_35460 [Cypionkella aquatica]